MPRKIPLPRSRNRRTKAAILQILALSHYASSKPAISITIRRRSWGSSFLGPVQAPAPSVSSWSRLFSRGGRASRAAAREP